MDGGAHSGDPGSRQAEAGGEVRERPLRVRLYDVGSAERVELCGQPLVLCVAGRGPDPGARLAVALVRALEIFLEIGQMAARARVHGSQPARFLGAAWISRRGRPPEGNKVLVARA